MLPRSSHTERDRITESNRQAWNAAAAVHAESQLDELRTAFKDPTYLSLDSAEQEMLNRIGLPFLDIIQPCCNNGRELISVERMGARSCLGIDISDAFIHQAHDLAKIAGAQTRFECADIYRLPRTLDQSFDLVLLTVGAITWMPDLEDFFIIVTGLLRPGGRILLYDMHPILWMFEAPEAELQYPYFDERPYISEEGLDYFGGTRYDSPESVCRQHTLSSVFAAMRAAGIRIDEFVEYDHDISNLYGYMDEWPARPPRSYSMIGHVHQ